MELGGIGIDKMELTPCLLCTHLTPLDLIMTSRECDVATNSKWSLKSAHNILKCKQDSNDLFIL